MDNRDFAERTEELRQPDRIEPASAEAALRASEERYRTLFETMDEGFALCELVRNQNGRQIDYRLLQLNPAFEKIIGIKPANAIGRLNSEVIPGIDDWWARTFAGMLEKGEPIRFEHELPQLNLWLDIRAFPYRDNIFYVLYDNITARRATVQALAHASADSLKWRGLYEAVLANTADLGYVFDLEHRFTYANDALLAMWGKTWEEAIGKNCLELGYPRWHAARHDREIEQVVATREPVRGEVPFHGVHGRRMYDYIFFPVLDKDGKVTAVAGTTRDITEIKAAETALRESEERFRLFVENVREYALVQTGLNYDITTWNPGAERMFGYSTEEVLGKPFSLLLAPEDIEAGILSEESSRAERGERNEDARWLVRKDGSRLWTRWVTEVIRNGRGVIVGLAKILRDETERLQTETSLRQSEKLAAVGRLASSIAHEINNPLEAVTNLIYLARNSPAPSATAQYLDLAERELRRVNLIATETLKFHRQASKPALVDLAEVMDSVLLLHEGRLHETHVIADRRYRLHSPITCLGNEIRQVLANLVGNAIDAMCANVGERRLIVCIRQAVHSRTAEPGIRLTVADNGSGMDKQTKARLFEPFYTTKETTGTGLGLWVTAGIVKKHQGTLRFHSRQSAPMSGTVFSLFLPANAPLR